MYPSKNIIENAVNSKDHDISSSKKAAGLVETLQGKGPLLFCTYQCRFC
jgi:uncharacterized surface protein with fasciclin (FAS1) repeats